MKIQVTSTILLLTIPLLYAQQSPTKAQFLAQQAQGCQALYNGIPAGGTIPHPVFSTEIMPVEALQCHYGSPVGGTGTSLASYCGASFTIQDSENYVDTVGFGNSSKNQPGMGFTNAWVNVDPTMFVDNTTASVKARAVFTTVMSYASTSGMGIVIKPSYTEVGSALWPVCAANTPAGLTVTGGAATANTSITFNVAATAVCGAGSAVACFYNGGTLQASGMTPSSLNGTWTVNGVPSGTQVIVTCLSNCVVPVSGTIIGWSIPSLHTCMTAENTSIKLGGTTPDNGGAACTGFGTGCSPIAWLAGFFTPSRFTVVTEPTTQNTGIGVPAAAGGSSALWEALGTGYSTQVHANSASTKIGFALSRYDGSSHTAMQGIIGKSGSAPPDYGGYDVYSMDPWNTGNGLGVQILDWQSDQALGMETIWGEWGRPNWSPGGCVAGNQTAYQADGNCDWNTLGINRQVHTAMAIYAASQGMSELNCFACGYMATYCAYAAPGSDNYSASPGGACKSGGPETNGLDNLTSAGYTNMIGSNPTSRATKGALGDATNPPHRTPFFSFMQQLIQWFPLIASGQQLPI